MNQVKVFISEDDLNKWLMEHPHYDIIDIKFQFAPPHLRRFMVWYKR